MSVGKALVDKPELHQGESGMIMRAMGVVGILVMCLGCATEPPFEWGKQGQEQISTFIQLIEETREMKTSGPEVTYRLEGTGFSPGRPLGLWLKKREKSEWAGIITIDEYGKARWKKRNGIGGKYSLANLLSRGVRPRASHEDADIVRIILIENAIGQGMEVAVHDEINGEVAFGKTPLAP
jgi:hypothetical protein